MSARLEVIQGPDQGWKYDFASSDIRIGTEPTYHIRLTDSAWKSGNIRVQLSQGGYLLTNHMPHPIYLDGEVIAIGANRTFYHGAILQPTAGTLLKFSPPAPVTDAKVTEDTLCSPPPVAPKSNRLRYFAITLLALAAGVFWYSTSTPAFDPATGEPHKKAVDELATKLRSSPRLSSEATKLKTALTDAVFFESTDQFKSASGKYQEARDSAKRLLREEALEPGDKASLQQIELYAAARLRVTGSK